jgi:hypothetical protein
LDIDRNCELAPLAILETALEITARALVAAYPELWLEDERGPMGHRVPPHIHKLLKDINSLRRRVGRYESAPPELAESRREDVDPDDEPF